MVLQLRTRSLISNSEEVIKEVSSKTIWSSVSNLNEAGKKKLKGTGRKVSIITNVAMFVRVIPGYSKYGEGEGCTSYKVPEGCHRGATCRDFMRFQNLRGLMRSSQVAIPRHASNSPSSPYVGGPAIACGSSESL